MQANTASPISRDTLEVIRSVFRTHLKGSDPFMVETFVNALTVAETLVWLGMLEGAKAAITAGIAEGPCIVESFLYAEAARLLPNGIGGARQRGRR